MTETREYHLEVWQGDLMVASVHGADFDTIHAEAMRYAFQYARDGTVEIRGIPADKFEQISAAARGEET